MYVYYKIILMLNQMIIQISLFVFPLLALTYNIFVFFSCFFSLITLVIWVSIQVVPLLFLLYLHRSYGSVFKSLHKETGQVLAIKQVPVDTDLQEIIKEISIMQQCDSKYIVKYYGSYFKNTDLWVSVRKKYCVHVMSD